MKQGSGNVFADIGMTRSRELLAKSELAARIAWAIHQRGLTQSAAARLLGIDQADVSNLIRGRLRGFSADRLFRFLNALGQDVEIVIRGRARARGMGRIRVVDDCPNSALGSSRGKR